MSVSAKKIVSNKVKDNEKLTFMFVSIHTWGKMEKIQINWRHVTYKHLLNNENHLEEYHPYIPSSKIDFTK